MSETSKKARHAATPFLLLLALGVVALFGELAPPAHADMTGKSGSRIASSSQSITSGATIISATDGRKIRIESMLLRSDTAGVVALKDGASGTTVLNVYLEANKPFLVPTDLLGDAAVLTAGNLLQATLSSATLTSVIRYRLE